MNQVQSRSEQIPLDAGTREQERLQALHTLDILETPPEDAFDRVARLIRNIFDVPTALVSLMDGHRQWHKACLGGDVDGAERRHSFCQYPVATGRPLVVENAKVHPVFADNPHVLAPGGVRFYAGVPLLTKAGHAVGTVCAVGTEPRGFSERDLAILQDLAQIAADQLELRERADSDALTGFLSRRAFKEQAAKAVSLALRHNHRLSILMIDIDRFKAVNDTHGHAVGDQVLAGVAAACSGELRSSDLIGRLGGEEFAVVLPYTDRAGALDVAEKLRLAVRRVRVQIGNVTLRSTVSLGAAELQAPVKSLDDLLAQADAALYAAKAKGRDCSIGWQPAEAPSRRRVLKSGRIVFNGRSSTVDCTIRSLGESGAGLDVWNSVDVPDRFSLLVLGDNREEECRVTVRGDKHLEVEFRRSSK